MNCELNHPSGFKRGLKILIDITKLGHGSYRQVCVKFKDFSRTSKILSYCFQGLKTYENTDLNIKILLRKC